MAYTIELDTQHLEPVRLEFVQGSVSEEITFKLKGYTLPSSRTFKIWYRDPYGILYSENMTQFGVFKAEIDTFVFPGVYTGAIQVVDNNDADEVLFSFPLIIKVEKNTRYYKWTLVAPEKGVAKTAPYTLSTGAMTPLGSRITAKIKDGIYTIEDGNTVSIPDQSTGPIDISYDSTSTGSEITVSINQGYSQPFLPYLVPEITFEAYGEGPVGYIVPTEDTVHPLRRQAIYSERVAGRADLPIATTYLLGPFEVMPDDSINISGVTVTPIEQKHLIISGIPTDGSVYTDPNLGTKFYFNKDEMCIIVTGSAQTQDQFDYPYIECSSYLFIEQ